MFGRFPFESHDTVSDGKLCERANPWAHQFWQDIQGLREVNQRECFLLLLDGRIMDIFGRLASFFFRILDCSELRYRYLSITVEPPECLAAGTAVLVLAFPDALPQEIPEEPEAPTWVSDCMKEREVFFVVPSALKKQLTTHIMHTQGGTHGSRSWSMRATKTNVLPLCPLVFSNRTRTLRHKQHGQETGTCSIKGPWKHSLRRL